jgi:tryptophanyl-tRNA synthetase
MDKILRAGADKARQMATPLMRELRHAVGLRTLSSGAATSAVKQRKTALPSFKQYREKDGQFYFKLLDAQGQLLLQSKGFASAQEAGQAIAHLYTQGLTGLSHMGALLQDLPPEKTQHVAQALQELLNFQKDRTACPP